MGSGQRVAVKTVTFAKRDATAWQWRCHRHVLLNSICAQQCAARASEHVCEVVGLCWEDMRAHIAMPLHEALDEHVASAANRGMPLHRVLELSCHLTRAVYKVHNCGILHCDINPGNVLLAEDGTPRLTDFGLAHINRNGFKTRTSIGHTLLYAPPEQVSGRVNKASDIYALGRTLAFAATGVKPSLEGQKMPREPAELRRLLELLTSDEKTRQEINLVQVIGGFERLLLTHGPVPVRRHSFAWPLDLTTLRISWAADLLMCFRRPLWSVAL